ncbi:hypothetical protein QF050_001606 [Arthrobacter sp. SLBN-112]|nr:hypothetical protein [Arthrobacter sp. SLBN-112]
MQHPRVQGPLKFQVGQDSLHPVGTALPSGARDAADSARLPITAGQEPGNVLFLAAVGPAKLRPDHAVSGFQAAAPEPAEFHAPVHRHAARLERLPQHVLDVGLPDQRQVREGGVREVRVAQPGFDYAPAQVDARVRGSVGAAEQLSGDSQRPQPFQCAGMEHHRPGRADTKRAAVHHPDRGAMRMCLEGRGEPGGTRADH